MTARKGLKKPTTVEGWLKTIKNKEIRKRALETHVVFGNDRCDSLSDAIYAVSGYSDCVVFLEYASQLAHVAEQFEINLNL